MTLSCRAAARTAWYAGTAGRNLPRLGSRQDLPVTTGADQVAPCVSLMALVASCVLALISTSVSLVPCTLCKLADSAAQSCDPALRLMGRPPTSSISRVVFVRTSTSVATWKVIVATAMMLPAGRDRPLVPCPVTRRTGTLALPDGV